MRSWSHDSSGRSRQRNTLRSTGAFTVIELMVVVTMLSFIFMMSVPTYQRIQRKAKATAIANDFRVFATIFQAHAHETGSWPAESAAGIVPTGMTPEELKYEDWTRTTPMGGKFDWEYNSIQSGGVTYRAAITITAVLPDAPLKLDGDLLLEIDRAIDDGDPTTGNLISGFGGSPLFIIEK